MKDNSLRDRIQGNWKQLSGDVRYEWGKLTHNDVEQIKGDVETLEDGSDAHSYVIKDTLTSTLLESIKVNGATIKQANVSAVNGIVHVIDKVLVPHFMMIL